MDTSGSIIILDFGGQYAHLIASRVRRFGVYSHILPPETPVAEYNDAAGIILSGGPQSVYDDDSPQADPALFELGIPVLGLCYGLHWMTQTLGGEVKAGHIKEYGKTDISVVDGGGQLFSDQWTVNSEQLNVWMSHGDEAAKLPDGFKQIATSKDCTNAAFADEDRKFYALQFHPEVTHTEHGIEMLENFVRLCDAKAWSMKSYKDYISQQILEEVGDRNVFMLVSGGVDSSVAFVLLNEILGHDRVQGLLVDTGLMRKGEVAMIKDAFDALGITNLHIEDASEEFFSNLQDVYAPEEKRQIIGNTFLDVQKRVSTSMDLDESWMLGQGTIYPDTIETGATKHADKIKTHHNRVEAIQRMIDQGLVIEPLKDLYKDEVRELGEELGLLHELVWRHPFPGPGLGVRILCCEASSPSELPELKIENGELKILPIQSVGVQGDGRTYRHAVALFSDQPCVISDDEWGQATEIPNASPDFNRVLKCTSHTSIDHDFVINSGYITSERADLLREADTIATEEIQTADLYSQIWQFPVVLLPFGLSDSGQSIVLRPIESVDAMTANAVHLPTDVLQKMTDRILQLDGIDCVFLDMTNKPPGTIEWE